MLVVFFDRVSGQSSTKNFQPVFRALGNGFYLCFSLRGGRKKGMMRNFPCHSWQVRSWALFNLCSWALKWTFIKWTFIPGTGLSCVCGAALTSLGSSCHYFFFFQGLYCVCFKVRTAYILLRCSVYLKTYWIWSCVHGSHTFLTPFPCFCFQCCIFPACLILVPCSYHNMHGVCFGQNNLIISSSSLLSFFCPFKPCYWRLVAMVTPLSVLRNKY